MLDLLKAAAQVSQQTGLESLPDDILSFSLEYSEKPNLGDERSRISELLEGEGFDLFFYSEEDDPEILILQFPGVQRQQSPEFLFATADSLVDALDLVSATPEIGAAWSEVESSRRATEGVGDIVSSFCTSKAPSPDDPNWATEMIRAIDARTAFGADGTDILVGQPDTGVADHRELDPGVDKSLGFNTLDNTSDPTDPLLSSMSSPGHGTATSSVVVSRPNHVITGSAPGATLVPVRCLNSVVIGGGAAVAKAIDHARRQDCRIVTMSLGGPIPGPALKRAIRRAVKADMIVLAAAGNCVGIVVYPAWDKNVIAVAAVDENKNRWKGSSRGSKVDISAPGENVHVARREAGSTSTPDQLKKIDARGQGTSYAVALTAGCAALWLQHFGFQDIRDEAQRRNMPVQELFRAALRATAQTPPGWDTSEMGAGIVDAHALLDQPLDQIPDASEVEDAHPGLVAFDEVFGLERHQPEVAFLAVDRLLRLDSERVAGLESAIAPRPSASLSELMPDADGTDFPAPAAIAAPETPPVPIAQALQRLAASHGAPLESAESLSADDALERVRNEGTDVIMDSVKSNLDHKRESASGRVDTKLQERALSDMDRVINELANPDSTTDFDEPGNRFAVEALVRLTGRPALRVLGNDEELEDPNIGSWAANLIPTRNRWRKLTNAVGRVDVIINDQWRHAGTGFVIQPGVIMTNRHVLDVFAESIPAQSGQDFVFTREPSIIFDPDAKDETTRYKIKKVISAGGERIGKFVDLAKLDMAVLEIETDNGTSAHPAPISVDPVSTTNTAIEHILLAGYPAKPSFSDAPSDPQDALAYWDRIEELYGDEYAVKYMSPGMIMKRPGHVDGDAKNWAFTHDATTLKGNSGSAIITLDGEMHFCGLHFGGSTLKLNLAHDIKTVFEGGDGVFTTDDFASG